MRRIGYLLNLFPKLSETFVLNEVVNLQHAGLDIVPISLERSAKLEAVQHPAAQRLVRAPVYAVDGFTREHLRTPVDWVLHRPRGLLRLIAANRRLPTPYGESRAVRLAIALWTGSLVVREQIDHLHAHWSYPADVAHMLAPILGVSVSL